MIDSEPAPAHQVGDARAVAVAVRGLAGEAEVAVGGLVEVLVRHLLEALQGGVVGAPAHGAAPWLDDLADEVDAAADGLQDRLRVVELDAELARQEGLERRAPGVQLRRVFMQQDEVVDVAHVVARAQPVLDELVEDVEVDVGEELARQVADRQAVVGVLGPGQFFGEGCMNGHPLRIATTTAMESCLITAITKQAMKATLHDQPAFSELFVAYLLTRNSRIEEDLIDQLFNSSERRLARMLLLLSHFGKEGSSQTITPNISQETLAEMIGTTRSRVSHFMNKFRKLGLISYNGHIEVNSSLLDAVLHDKPELKEDE